MNAIVLSSSKKGGMRKLRNPLPNAIYHVDGDENGPGYATYETDALGRVVDVKVDSLLLARNTFTRQNDLRNTSDQGAVGRQATGSHGGHLIGREFYGAGEGLNMVAMPAQMNSRSDLAGSWREMEVKWADHLLANESVSVHIRPIYEGESTVPTDILVEYRVNGGKPIKAEFGEWYK
jgi:hypothetical protein